MMPRQLTEEIEEVHPELPASFTAADPFSIWVEAGEGYRINIQMLG